MSNLIDGDINGDGHSLIDVVLYGQNVQMPKGEWEKLQNEMKDGVYPTKKELISFNPIFDSAHITPKGAWNPNYSVTDPDAYIEAHPKGNSLRQGNQPSDMPVYDRIINYTFKDNEAYLDEKQGGGWREGVSRPTFWYHLKASNWFGGNRGKEEKRRFKSKTEFDTYQKEKHNKQLEDQAAEQIYRQRVDEWQDKRTANLLDVVKRGFDRMRTGNKAFQYDKIGEKDV